MSGLGYYFECPSCDNVHDLEVDHDSWDNGVPFRPVITNAPHRACDDCGADGCVDCVSDTTGLCIVCRRKTSRTGRRASRA